MTDLTAPTAFLDRLADAASDSIMPHFRAGAAVEDKGADAFDPVTAADRAAEAAMRAFITGLPVWGTLIGLTRAGAPLIGMMAQPFTGERFAGDGRRAWYSGPGGRRDLSTRPCEALSEAALFTTTPALFDGDDRRAYERVERSVRLARYGCDCYAYCMVAAGHADVVIEAGLAPYDIVALIPIIVGAGGQVTDWQGNSAAAGGRVVASGDRRLHDQVLATLAGG